MLIKLDDQQLGWMAADRARFIAVGSRDPLISAEAARNLAVLARKAGWHAQATSIALTAAASPGLRGRTAAGGAAPRMTCWPRPWRHWTRVSLLKTHSNALCVPISICWSSVM